MTDSVEINPLIYLLAFGVGFFLLYIFLSSGKSSGLKKREDIESKKLKKNEIEITPNTTEEMISFKLSAISEQLNTITTQLKVIALGIGVGVLYFLNEILDILREQ